LVCDVGISGFSSVLGEQPEIATVQIAPIGAEPRNDDLKIKIIFKLKHYRELDKVQEENLDKEQSMTSQWFFVLLTTLFFGLFNIFIRAAGPKIGGVLGPLLVEGFAAAILLLFFLWRRWNGSVEPVTFSGVAFSMAAGFCAAAGSIGFFTVFSRGGQLSAAGSFVLVGSTLLTILGGFILFKEPINTYRVVGIILGLISLFLLRID
jgi:drug/metabolite transporter (DMT)-like permease